MPLIHGEVLKNAGNVKGALTLLAIRFGSIAMLALILIKTQGRLWIS
jgi:hypothetical protein